MEQQERKRRGLNEEINRGQEKKIDAEERESKESRQEDNNAPWISNGVMCWVSLLLTAFIAEQQCDFSDV